MNKNFFKGFISGLFVTLLIVLTIFSGMNIYKYISKNTTNYSNRYFLSNSKKDKIKSVDYQKIADKLSYLETLIDEVFLEDVDNDQYEEGIYKGFIASLRDPYSTYYTAEEYESLMESSSGVYYGIGSTVSQNVSTGIISIVKPFVNGPAFKAGILPGDVIYKVEGEEVTGVDISEVVSRMKGPEGTKVSIEVIREGEKEAIPFTLTRRKIEVPTIEYEVLKGNIGYILISEFDEITVKQFNEAIDKLEKQKVTGLIIDVRDNPGGLLSSVVKMVDRIIDKGLVVYTEDKYGNREEESAVDSNKFNKPLVIMINGNSASASEIFAGTIQDYGAGKILGTTSFGKGIVQRVIPLSDNTAVKLTISKYYTAKGRDVHEVGIEPDIEVELDEELRKKVVIQHDEDNQLQEAIKVIKKMAK